MKKILTAVLPLSVLCAMPIAHAATSDGKTWGVSAGWLHV